MYKPILRKMHKLILRKMFKLILRKMFKLILRKMFKPILRKMEKFILRKMYKIIFFFQTWFYTFKCDNWQLQTSKGVTQSPLPVLPRVVSLRIDFSEGVSF